MGYSRCYYGPSGHCTLVRAIMNRKAPECLGCFIHVQVEGADLGHYRDYVSGLALNSSVSPMVSFYLLTSYKVLFTALLKTHCLMKTHQTIFIMLLKHLQELHQCHLSFHLVLHWLCDIVIRALLLLVSRLLVLPVGGDSLLYCLTAVVSQNYLKTKKMSLLVVLGMNLNIR